MEITRKALYAALWRKPRKELALDWGVNANAITAVSNQKKIPFPPSGHWTLVSMGRSPDQPPLEGNPDESITLEDRPLKKPKKPEKETVKPLKTPRSNGTTETASDTRPSTPDSTVPSVVTTISEALPSVRKAYKTYASPKAERDFKYQHVLPGSADVIRIAVMPTMVERALLLMDAILREFQKHHWKVETPSQKDRSKNSVIIDGVEILFTITEHRKQERIKSEDKWRKWEYRYHSTGTLRFQFGAGSWMREIKDNKRILLEDQIPNIIQSIRNEVAQAKNAEAERNNRERINRLKDRLSGLVRKALEYNQQCYKNLDQYLTEHQQARKIRSFADSMKQANAPECYTPQQEQWLAWLQQKADSIDPALSTDSLDFSTPRDLKDQVCEMIEADLERYGPLNELDIESAIQESVRLMKLQ